MPSPPPSPAPCGCSFLAAGVTGAALALGAGSGAFRGTCGGRLACPPSSEVKSACSTNPSPETLSSRGELSCPTTSSRLLTGSGAGACAMAPWPMAAILSRIPASPPGICISALSKSWTPSTGPDSEGSFLGVSVGKHENKPMVYFFILFLLFSVAVVVLSGNSASGCWVKQVHANAGGPKNCSPSPSTSSRQLSILSLHKFVEIGSGLRSCGQMTSDAPTVC
mmetsp:Transcript_16469/g.39350  ORF Transcript_16469/g.39350 Transcript_16469/m.39350 type:complete len:223 (-) Transcript_16469:7-675(-)